MVQQNDLSAVYPRGRVRDILRYCEINFLKIQDIFWRIYDIHHIPAIISNLNPIDRNSGLRIRLEDLRIRLADLPKFRENFGEKSLIC